MAIFIGKTSKSRRGANYNNSGLETRRHISENYALMNTNCDKLAQQANGDKSLGGCEGGGPRQRRLLAKT